MNKFIFITTLLAMLCMSAGEVSMVVIGLTIYFSMVIVVIMESDRRFKAFEKRVRGG